MKYKEEIVGSYKLNKKYYIISLLLIMILLSVYIYLYIDNSKNNLLRGLLLVPMGFSAFINMICLLNIFILTSKK